MAASWSGFQAAAEQAVYTVWTQVKPTAGGGIWDADRIARIDFNRVHAPTGTLKYPYAVIEYGEAQVAAGSPITAKVYEVEVTFHYFTRLEEGSNGQATLRDRLEAMEDYLMATGLGNSFPVLAVTHFALGTGHPATELFQTANLPWIAGSVTVRCWVGES